MGKHPDGQELTASVMTVEGGFTNTLLADLDAAIKSGSMLPYQASETRGRSGWVASNSFGRIGRIGSSVLKHLQYQHQLTGRLTQEQVASLRFHRLVIERVPPRQLQILHRRRQVVTIYSDAEFEPGSGRPPRLGWVLFHVHGGQPIG